MLVRPFDITSSL